MLYILIMCIILLCLSGLSKSATTTTKKVIQTTTVQKTIYYCTAKSGVNVRYTPSSNSTIVGKLKYGEAVEVLEKGTSFTKISYKHSRGETAWVSTNYISPTKPTPKVTTSTTSKPTSNNTAKKESSSTSLQSTSATTPTKGIHNGHEYVDLGLSVKWATCNLGADSPEDYGNYFAWGETKPKRNSTYSYPDPFTIPLSDDAAHVNWGGSWRMPTVEEQQELVTKCTLKWTTQNGVSGYKVTSKRNGNSIFLPAAGYHTGLSIAQAGDQGYYWSSSRAHYSHMAMYLYFYSSNVHLFNQNRYEGCSVRPVCK